MNTIKENYKLYDEILLTIQKYHNIVLYRHSDPDFDASGSQLGLYHFLKDNFPEKNIYVEGKDFADYVPSLFEHVEEIDVSLLKPFLAIILDTGAVHRIDNDNYHEADMIIKIDHHPNVEPYGNINLVNDHLISASELISDMIAYWGKKYTLSPLSAKYLFTGIVGDSGRFRYQETSAHTFEVAAYLMATGINTYNDIYSPMYARSLSWLKNERYILNHFTLTESGFCYYYLSDVELQALGLHPSQAKIFLELFAPIEEVKVWASLTEDVEKHEIRISLRSKGIVLEDLAKKYHGGGHKFASGARAYSKEEMDAFILDADKLVKENQ